MPTRTGRAYTSCRHSLAISLIMVVHALLSHSHKRWLQQQWHGWFGQLPKVELEHGSQSDRILIVHTDGPWIGFKASADVLHAALHPTKTIDSLQQARKSVAIPASAQLDTLECTRVLAVSPLSRYHAAPRPRTAGAQGQAPRLPRRSTSPLMKLQTRTAGAFF